MFPLDLGSRNATTRLCKRNGGDDDDDDDDDDAIAYFSVRWKTRRLVLVYRTKTKNYKL